MQTKQTIAIIGATGSMGSAISKSLSKGNYRLLLCANDFDKVRGWREKFGINIVYIKRGEKLIQIPGRDNCLMPFDQVGIIATDAQIQSFKPMFDSVENIAMEHTGVDDIILQKVIVDEHTKLRDIDIRCLGLRERTGGIIVGIERDKERILNPESNVKLEWGDVLWIVGDKKKIQQLYKDK